MASFTEEETRQHDYHGFESLVTRFKIFHTGNGLTYYGMGYYKKPDTFGTRTNMIGFKYLFNDELLDEVFGIEQHEAEKWVWSDTRKSWMIQR